MSETIKKIKEDEPNVNDSEKRGIDMNANFKEV